MAANERQEGGEHYRAKGDKLQHWDLAVMFGWDPFQYQITKYVMRWKDKHATHAERVQDLKKALHFLEKYIEEAAHYDPRATPLERITELGALDTLARKQVATSMAEDALYSNDFTVEGYFGDNTQHYKCVHCRGMVRASSLLEAHRTHGACAAAHSQFQHP